MGKVTTAPGLLPADDKSLASGAGVSLSSTDHADDVHLLRVTFRLS